MTQDRDWHSRVRMWTEFRRGKNHVVVRLSPSVRVAVPRLRLVPPAQARGPGVSTNYNRRCGSSTGFVA